MNDQIKTEPKETPQTARPRLSGELGDSIEIVLMLGKLAHALMHANEKSVCNAAPNGRYFDVLSEYEILRVKITKSPN